MPVRFTRKIPAKAVRITKRILQGLLALLVMFLLVRIYETERGPALHSWHKWVPDEMHVREIDRATFRDYKVAEEKLFREMKTEVAEKITADEKTPLNRYYEGSLVYPEKFAQDWNRSYILIPEGTPRGAVVLLHGLTDSPYSLRHIAERYRQRGFVAIAPRLPGHGTVPAALTQVNWEDWMAVTRLSVREATRLAGSATPLHIVGFSNGGALAMKYALDSLDDKSLRRAQQIILLSPMIGVTSFARFARLAGLPAILPPFAKAAWLNIVPEFNPFKYNSFPVKAARQSWLLTQALQQQLVRYSRRQKIDKLPPVLTFQSVMDSTVSARAVVISLYNHLGNNGSELVVFDINQAVSFRPLFRHSSYTAINTLLPRVPQQYSTTIITNASECSLNMVAKTTPAGQLDETVQPLSLHYPADIYSLSHVALPFPATDSLYGQKPANSKPFGINFGTIHMRGETGVLMVGPESLMRVTSNPFFPYMMERIERDISQH